MNVPYQAESPEQLKSRYAKAIEAVYDQRSEDSPKPGEGREHVFDFENGLRIIISRDIWEDGKEGIHFSGSVEPNTYLFKKILRSTKAAKSKEDMAGVLKLVINHIVKQFVFLAGLEGTSKGILFVGLSNGKGVPHFRVVEEVACPNPNPSA